MMARALLIIFTASILFSCAPSRIVKPLEKGQKAVGANLGGPLIGFAGTTIPIPLTSVYYAQGVKQNTTAFGSIHATSLLFGVIQTDIGICQKIFYHDSLHFGFSANPALNLAFDKWEKHFKCWPELDLNFYWDAVPQKLFLYAGAENWFEFASKKAFDRPQQTHMLFCPQLGITRTRKKWNYNLEVKWMAPGTPNTPNVVDYRGIAGKGAVGVYFGVLRKF